MTPQRTLQFSVAALAVATLALVVAGLYAAGIIGSGQKLAPTDRSSSTGSLRTEGNLHVDRSATVSGSLDVTGPTTINDLIANGGARLSAVHGTGAAQFESTLTATQGIFTVGTGRPPLVVSSATLVPNLHANNTDLLAGQTSTFFVDVSATPQAKAGPLGVGSLTSGPATINGLETVSGPLTVAGVASLNGNLNVAGIASLGTVNVSGTQNVPGTSNLGLVSTTGAANIGGDLNVNGATTLQLLNLVSLAVQNDAKVGRNLAVGGATNIGGPLTVTGATALNGGLAVTGNESVSGDSSVGGTITATGHITGQGGLTVASGAAVTGILTADSLVVTGTARVDGQASVGGAPAAGKELTVIGDSQFAGDVNVTGSLSTTGLLSSTGGLTSSGGAVNLSNGGNSLVIGGGGTAVNGPFSASGLSSLNGGANVTGLLTAASGATISSGDLQVLAGNGVFSGQVTASQFNGTLNGTINGASGTFTTITVTGATNLQGATQTAGVTNTGGLASSGGTISLTGGVGKSITIDGTGTTVAGPFTAAVLSGSSLTLSGDVNAVNGRFSGSLFSDALTTFSGATLTVSPNTLQITTPGGSNITGALQVTNAIGGASLNVGLGTIQGGAITGTGVNVGLGTVSAGTLAGGAVTGTSLNVGGVIQGGGITGTGLTVTGAGAVTTPNLVVATLATVKSLTVNTTSSFLGAVAVTNTTFDVTNGGKTVVHAAPGVVTIGDSVANVAFTVNGNTSVTGTLNVAGVATLGELAGGRFRGTCTTGAVPSANITCNIIGGPLAAAPVVVLVTPGGDFRGATTANRYWVNSFTPGSFHLHFNAAPAANVTFYYLVVE